ncbi:hypothetical protein FEE95_16645 [Maribacter algarum]|uniref:DUF4129 domain-containing protein n=1 Tax=Maribacter algarum (ex Zhang et al. 2020) TaxID=2578118 RepID=A0A5S3PP91_9FLAO|nr:hypothetical protein [Maribacter algarum]TMM56246.1 hypothetical protein FEE95_16645 [Maribacter algarum]
MRNKTPFLYAFWFALGMVVSNAQEIEVPDVPEEVRVLPNTFKENYTGKAYDYVETTSSLARFRSWLGDLFSSWFRIESESAGNIISVFYYLFWILVILLVIYLIVKVVLNKEIRWIFKRNKEETQNLNFDIGENIREVDFNSLISEAVSNADYRSAIRYYYLFLLKKLDQFEVIDYDAQKTTFDYQLEVEGSKYAPGFSKATYYYTYIWYGEFSIDEGEYKQTSSVYNELLKQFKG